MAVRRYATVVDANEDAALGTTRDDVERPDGVSSCGSVDVESNEFCIQSSLDGWRR